MPRARPLIIAAMLTVVLPGGARAATVSAIASASEGAKDSLEYMNDVHVVDGSGLADALSISHDGTGGSVTVRDGAGNLSPGDGCNGGGAVVSCVLPSSPYETDLTVDAGGGDDSVSVGPGFNSDIHGGTGDDRLTVVDGINTLSGDAGDDVLTGGALDDTLDGGPGADTLSGGAGAGTDTVSYADRTAAVTARIGTASGNGEAGENDAIAGDVENLTGGAGADTLVGNRLDNLIRGGGGADHIDGAGGDDRLYGADNHYPPLTDYPAGADVVAGGDGADQITIGSGGSADGQAGADRLDISGAASATGGPGPDQLTTHGPGATLSSDDGERDVLRCAGAAAAVTADDLDVPLGCGAAVHRDRPGVAAIVRTDLAFPDRYSTSLPAGVEIGCPDDAQQRCSVVVRTLFGTRAIGIARARPLPGSATVIDVRTDELARLLFVRDHRLILTFALDTRDATGAAHSEQVTACQMDPFWDPDACNGWSAGARLPPAPRAPRLGRLHVTHAGRRGIAVRLLGNAFDAGRLDCTTTWGDGRRDEAPFVGFGELRARHRYRHAGRYRIRTTCEAFGVRRTRTAVVRVAR